MPVCKLEIITSKKSILDFEILLLLSTDQVIFQNRVFTLFKIVSRNFFLFHDKSMYYKFTGFFQMVLVQQISVTNIFCISTKGILQFTSQKMYITPDKQCLKSAKVDFS